MGGCEDWRIGGFKSTVFLRFLKLLLRLLLFFVFFVPAVGIVSFITLYLLQGITRLVSLVRLPASDPKSSRSSNPPILHPPHPRSPIPRSSNTVIRPSPCQDRALATVRFLASFDEVRRARSLIVDISRVGSRGCVISGGAGIAASSSLHSRSGATISDLRM